MWNINCCARGKKLKKCAKNVNYNPAVKYRSSPEYGVRAASTMSHEFMQPALPTGKEKSRALETHAPGLGEHLTCRRDQSHF